jgi:hypothetical protein
MIEISPVGPCKCWYNVLIPTTTPLSYYSYRKTLHVVLFFDAMHMLLAEGVVTHQENLSIKCWQTNRGRIKVDLVSAWKIVSSRSRDLFQRQRRWQQMGPRPLVLCEEQISRSRILNGPGHVLPQQHAWEDLSHSKNRKDISFRNT